MQKRKINIGFDAKRYFHNKRGLGNYSRNLVNQIARQYPQHSLSLFSPSRGELYPAPRGASIISNPGWKKSRWPNAVWRSMGIGRLPYFKALDIYHGLSHELPILTSKSRPKLVVTIHDLIFLLRPQLYPFVDRQVYLQKIKHACKVADLVVAISEQTSFDLQKYLEVPTSKIKVLYQSIDEQYFESVEPSHRAAILDKFELSSNYLLYVGAIEKRKNVLKLVEIMQGLPEERLLVVGRGSGSYFKKVQKAAKKANVTIRSDIDTPALASIYQSAKMLVYPSTYEGFGLPVAEAIASGLPVITTAGGCFPEAGGPRSIYVKPKRKKILEAIRALIAQPEQANQMTAVGLEHAQKFRPGRCARLMMETYYDLIEDL